jgi:hypothetical protein
MKNFAMQIIRHTGWVLIGILIVSGVYPYRVFGGEGFSQEKHHAGRKESGERRDGGFEK